MLSTQFSDLGRSSDRSSSTCVSNKSVWEVTVSLGISYLKTLRFCCGAGSSEELLRFDVMPMAGSSSPCPTIAIVVARYAGIRCLSFKVILQLNKYSFDQALNIFSSTNKWPCILASKPSLDLIKICLWGIHVVLRFFSHHSTVIRNWKSNLGTFARLTYSGISVDALQV